MAKKEFNKKYMHPTRRKLVDMVLSGGEYDKNTQISLSDIKEKVKRTIGDIWEDEHSRYEQKNGYVLKTSKNSKVFEDVRKYLSEKSNCKNSECTKVKYGTTDKKLISKTGFCSYCLADKEAEIKRDGLFDEYATYRISQNQLAYAKDLLENLNDALLNVKSKLEYVNENGTTETWTIDRPIDELKAEIQEDINKVKTEVKKVIETRDNAWEKLKVKNYDLISNPIQIEI
jgi:hypothetical protein